MLMLRYSKRDILYCNTLGKRMQIYKCRETLFNHTIGHGINRAEPCRDKIPMCLYEHRTYEIVFASRFNRLVQVRRERLIRTEQSHNNSTIKILRIRASLAREKRPAREKNMRKLQPR